LARSFFLLNPIYAFADSRLLFWKQEDGSLFLNNIKPSSDKDGLTAAYIGASNHDDLTFYHDIFEPAMEQIGVDQCRMILTRPLPDDGMFLQEADIILLAGGSVETGWRAFENNGFKELIPRRFYDGAVLVGISAGAVQLGLGGLTDDGTKPLTTFSLLPFYVEVHEESGTWTSLSDTLSHAQTQTRGISIPGGGGIIYNPLTGDVEPICKPIIEILMENGISREAIILPGSAEEDKISK